MWVCQKCHERHEDSFEVCWKCGTSKAGVEDPAFRPADQIDPASLERPAIPAVEEMASATAPRPTVSRAGRSAYEFSPSQNEVIASLASYMKIVGIVSFIGGVLLIVSGAVQIGKGGVAALIQGVLALVIGGLTVHASREFRQIVDTQGSDIGHLMTALGALRSLYRLQVILLCIAIAILALAFCVVTLR